VLDVLPQELNEQLGESDGGGAKGDSDYRVDGVECARGIRSGRPWRVASSTAQHLNQTVAANYGAQRIRVNCIAPGLIDTPMVRGRMDFARGDQEQPADDPPNSRPPAAALGRIGKASEIAATALFLASDDASYVSGVVRPVDGGWVASGGGARG
jgi:enoyl-[acyl-carrier-protein] reductase (NADH)